MNALPLQDDAPLPLGTAPNVVIFQSKRRLHEINSSPEPRYSRRLADQITASFYEACRIGNLDVARQLMESLEFEVLRSIRVAGVEDRHDGDDAAAVQVRYALEVKRRQQDGNGRGSPEG